MGRLGDGCVSRCSGRNVNSNGVRRVQRVERIERIEYGGVHDGRRTREEDRGRQGPWRGERREDDAIPLDDDVHFLT
jgi:hypothetical protein